MFPYQDDTTVMEEVFHKTVVNPSCDEIGFILCTVFFMIGVLSYIISQKLPKDFYPGGFIPYIVPPVPKPPEAPTAFRGSSTVDSVFLRSYRKSLLISPPIQSRFESLAEYVERGEKIRANRNMMYEAHRSQLLNTLKPKRKTTMKIVDLDQPQQKTVDLIQVEEYDFFQFPKGARNNVYQRLKVINSSAIKYRKVDTGSTYDGSHDCQVVELDCELHVKRKY